jgi:hypothetical protein
MSGKTVVMYPGLDVSHLSPMLELSDDLLRHGGGAVDIAIMLVEPSFHDNTTPPSKLLSPAPSGEFLAARILSPLLCARSSLLPPSAALPCGRLIFLRGER